MSFARPLSRALPSALPSALTGRGGAGSTAVVILVGQSLNAARGTITQSGTAEGVEMFNGGAHGSAMNYWSANPEHIAWGGEFTSLSTYAEGGDGQTPGAGLGDFILGSTFSDAIICSMAIGARQLVTLAGQGPLANVYAAIQRGCELAPNPAKVMFYVAHGEADAAAGTSETDYYNRARDFCETLQLAASQFMQDSSYTAPVYWTYPLLSANGDQDIAIKNAIRSLAADVSGVESLGPIYQWPAESDRVHPTPGGYVQRGEAAGRAFQRFFDLSESPDPLNITSVTLSGTTAVVTFNQNIVRDTDGAGENLDTANAEDGFQWYDNGTAVAISSVSYSGAQATLTLASTPSGSLAQQTLRIGNQDTDTSLKVGIGWLSGSLVRADVTGWTSTFDDTYTNYPWAGPQEVSGVSAP